ncbi:MAG: phosphonate C-P lyase system protein PhnH [Anaerolineae bacterium]|nr:phosphonate C-P lyase system protein PhnH [Anaerolineae bacterium]
MADIQITTQEALTQQVFAGLMWALSYPGQAYPLPDDGLSAFSAIGETLVDLETSYFTPHAGLDRYLSQLGGRSKSPNEALYQFYPTLDKSDLANLRHAPTGSYLVPDESATLVIGAAIGAGRGLRLSGPGIQGENDISIGDLPLEFWALRAQMRAYPLGWDIFLVGNDRVLGLPRTTHVEVL